MKKRKYYCGKQCFKKKVEFTNDAVGEDDEWVLSFRIRNNYLNLTFGVLKYKKNIFERNKNCNQRLR